MNGENFTLPFPMRKADFYTSPEIAEKFRALRWPPEYLDTTSEPYIGYVDGGPFDRALLRRIDLFRAKTNRSQVFAQLFAKVHHPGKKIIWGYRGKQDIAQRVDYEVKNMQYWNILGLPSPFYFAMVREGVEVSGGINPMDSYTVLMTYMPAPTHDRDVLILNEIESKYREALNDLFLPASEKEKIKLVIGRLQNERKKIVGSILRTQAQTHVLGTYHQQNGGTYMAPEGPRQKNIAKLIDLAPRRPENFVEDEHQVREHYLRSYHLYQLVKKKEISAEDAQRSLLENRLPSVPGNSYHTKASEFQTLFDPILNALFSEPALLRYVHGDEFLHHYAYKTPHEGFTLYWVRALGESISVYSAMLDSTNAKIGLLEEGLANTLLSPLLSLSSPEIETFLNGYLRDCSRFAKHYSERREGIQSLIPSYGLEHLLDRFDLISLHVLLKCIGLKAKDEIHNKQHFDFFKNRNGEYKHADSRIKFPEETIAGIDPKPRSFSYSPYATESALPKLQQTLRKRVEAFLKRQRDQTSPYKHLEEAVKKLDELFFKYSYYLSS